MKIKKISLDQKGFSVLEVIIAAGLFIVFAGGGVGAILQSFNLNRLGEEQTVANNFGSEGLEAARSIRNQSFNNLQSTLCSQGSGITQTGGIWTFKGTNTNDVFGKYTRVVKVCDVQRNGSGDIVGSGGTQDTQTKKITATVTWSSSPTRPNTINLVTYLTNWKVKRGGMIVYGDGGTTTDAIRYKLFNANTSVWDTAAQAADVDGSSTNRSPRIVRLYASPTRDEKVMLSRHFNGTTQYIYAQVYNGTSWGNVTLLSNWNANTFLDVKNYDGAYLKNGDFIATYSDNTSTPKFAVWNGSTWTTNIAMRDQATNGGGIPNFIVTKTRPGTNEVMVSILDQSKDTDTQYFNGSSYVTGSWTLHGRHASNSPSNGKELVDFAWLSNGNAGALVYTSSNKDKNIDIKIWTPNGSGSGSWTAASSSSNTGSLNTLNITARPNNSDFIACEKDKVQTIECFKANITPTWTVPANNALTNSTDNGAQRSYEINYEPLSAARAIAVYSDNTSMPKIKQYDPANSANGTFDTNAVSINNLSGTLKTVRTVPHTYANDIMILMGDANNRLYSVAWNGDTHQLYTTPAGKAFAAHGINGSATTEQWYDFTWDLY